MAFQNEDEWDEDEELDDGDDSCEICGLYFCDCAEFTSDDEYLD